MARAPLVSVCMTSYNYARFLPFALDSILSQEFRDFELLVVDDGSTDGSLEILESYGRQNPGRVRVFTHPGRRRLGISASDNLMIKEARGAYWCPQDSDDVSYPDRLARQVAFLESHPETGWVYSVADYIDKNGKPLGGQLGSDLSAFPDLAEELILANLICGPSVMVRMHCMFEVGPFEPGLMYGDWEFWIRLALRYPAAFLPGAVAGYRCHNENASMTGPHHDQVARYSERELENLRYSLEAITCLRRKADEGEGPLARPRIKALLDLRRAAFCMLLNDHASASRAAATVFRTDPSFRYSLQQLAHCLKHFQSLRLAFMMIRDLGFPPRWLADRDFISALFHTALHRVRRTV